MVLDPVNAVTSVNFYRKVAAQGLARSLLYLTYLAVIYAAVGTVWYRVKIWPAMAESLTWLETSIPPITFAEGRLSTPTNQLVTVRNPKLNELAFIIDTGRTEPVTPQLLEENKVIAYVTSTALYMQQPGKPELTVLDFSKDATAASGTLDGRFFRRFSAFLSYFIPPATFAMSFLMFLCWKTFVSFFYSLVALIVNGIEEGGLEYPALFSIGVYAQTLALVITGVMIAAAGMPPFFHLLAGKINIVAVALTTLYIWLAVKRIKTPAA